MNPKQIVLHPQTRTQCMSFIDNPSHALLLTGSKGVGKDYVAQMMASELLDVDAQQSTNAVLSIAPDEKGTISVEAIREINQFLKLKTPGSKAIRRVIHISSAAAMTGEAQNALLKNLEEPPADTVIILTAVSEQDLLQTIVSRVRTIDVKTPSLQQVEEFFSQSTNADFTSTLRMSAGLPGLLYELLNESDGRHTTAITNAKRFVQATVYERLTLIQEHQSSTEQVADLLWALEKVARAAQQSSARKNADSTIQRLNKVREAVLYSQHSSNRFASRKLLLTDLALQL